MSERRACSKGLQNEKVSGKLVNRAPLAAEEAHELGCVDGEKDAFRPIRSDGITSFHEFMSLGRQKGTKGETENVKLGRYELYVVSPQFREGLGVALIDSGSMVSLVRESSVTRFERRGHQVVLQGITGKEMNVLGSIDLKIENMLENLTQKCYVVDSLPRNLDAIFGQDWLANAGYGIQKKEPVVVPPYSEQVIKCQTKERGVRFIEHQLIQPGLIAATSLVNCERDEFPCLVVNLTNQSINVITSPKLQKPPTMIRGKDSGSPTKVTNVKRLQLLKEKLRLGHILEGANDIKKNL
jgi:hypothetical protein